jgi:hypothetical protein
MNGMMTECHLVFAYGKDINGISCYEPLLNPYGAEMYYDYHGNN